MSVGARAVFETDRLRVRAATEADVDLYLALWRDPRVMRLVGFPEGIPVTRERVTEQIRASAAMESEFGQLLVVELLDSGETIGEAKMYLPNAEGISRTDVKLRPEWWGHRYGVEVKRGLVRHLFAHTDCSAVEATPNRENVASIRMQEAVGGVMVGEGVCTDHFDAPYATCAVPYLLYRVYREGSK